MHAKLNDSKTLMLTFIMHALDNQNQFPTNLDQIQIPGLTGTNEFEIVYTGSLDALTNKTSVIAIREKQAWQLTDGGWAKVYGFARSEEHTSELQSQSNLVCRLLLEKKITTAKL